MQDGCNIFIFDYIFSNLMILRHCFSVHQLQPSPAFHDEVSGSVILWWEAETDGDRHPASNY
jgi:hypothetical protein